MTTSNIVMSGKTLSRRTFVELVVCMYVCMKVHLHTNITVRDVILCSCVYECKHYLCYVRDIKIRDVCMYACMHGRPTLSNSSQLLRKVPSHPLNPIPSTISWVRRNGTVSGYRVCMYVCMFICM